MVTTLDDTKRMAIAQKLADMRAIQNLLISTEQKLISSAPDQDVRERLQNMLADDQKNLGVLETVLVQYGIQSEPHDTMKKFVEQAEQMMSGSELSFYQKLIQHELLKHGQVMSGIVVHKAAQVVGADIEVAIGPLNTVNFENRAHQEQLKGLLELVGVRELTGKDADQGLWARVQDAVAALSGVAGSVLTQNSDKQDMNIQTLIRLDHNKVNTLFTEVGTTKDPQKLQEYFGQIYKDLTAHAIAEEQVVYPKVRPFYGEGDTQELYDEQAEMKQMLDEIKSMSPADADAFRSKIKQLMEAVGDHIRQEESTMFAAIDKNCTDEQKEQMATEFKTAKAKIQEEMAASMK
ncbi:hemerythrin domain-containing protein [Funiculus sociatus GB2-A5]|uniref:Hemerythrin domain-containing protein n=1 Tax=Funiculus sociatus GB2-A5 TaxID=2933946 RepID=A0ABV0JM39_9CYAN|nr:MULTISPECIES: hemerythrin domain-containing protein [unclassified Trichocoleus]MBD1903991.1 hemerythrin domain-containing protein [Trichocoleus sp. FACHB-832]MBD2062762.1 hemerythrin domain-containing protein [Trichocoleus sp. FACHB-6]